MAETKEKCWYVKGGEEDKLFGPIDLDTLIAWAKDSRIEPTFSVSKDKTSWIPAPFMSELEMIWLVETEPGTFYGPFNRAVVDSLLEAGTLNKSVRLYELDTGSNAAEKTRLETELAAKSQALADLEARAAKQAETTKKTMEFMEAKVAELSGALVSAGQAADQQLAAAGEEIYAQRERGEKAEAQAAANLSRAEKAEAAQAAAAKKLSVAETEIADLRAQLEMVTKFTAVKPAAKATVVQPEVVISSAPPPKSAPHFPGMGSSSGLAALEAAARRELAAAKKHGLGIGGLFGGKK